jgi:putative heme-binding domain-containing protein
MRLFLSLVLFLAPLAAQEHGSITGNPFTTPEDRAAGAQSFKSQCAACHGLDASGAAAGPDLSTGAFKHGGTDEALFRTITKGVAGTPMVGFNLNGREVWQLITFLRYLSIGKAAEKAKGDAAKGAQIFSSSGCVRCHTVGTEGGLSGPDLSEVGSRRSLAQLESAVLDPSAEVSPDYWSLRARTKSGATISGIRLNEDMDSFQLLESTGRLRSVMKADLATFEIVRTSPMPSFKGKLQGAGLEDLIAYLASLRAPQEESK